MREDNREVYDFYEKCGEIDRLERGLGRVEGARSKELLTRFLESYKAGMPERKYKILDVGGGAGYYSDWLAGQGYDVTLIELAPSAVEYARTHQSALYRAEVGDARDLSGIASESMDAVLLMGPLYHLLEREERLLALREARRVLKPGGILCAAGISKFSSATWAVSVYGENNEFLSDDIYFHMLEGEIKEGRHIRPPEYPNFIAQAYFHTPKELSGELEAAGFSCEGVYAVEGCVWFCPALQEKWDIPESRERLLQLIRMTEREDSMLGISPHFLALGRKRQKA